MTKSKRTLGEKASHAFFTVTGVTTVFPKTYKELREAQAAIKRSEKKLAEYDEMKRKGK